jgi:hypothetical protein
MTFDPKIKMTEQNEILTKAESVGELIEIRGVWGWQTNSQAGLRKYCQSPWAGKVRQHGSDN